MAAGRPATPHTPAAAAVDAGEHKQLFLQDVTLLEDRSELNTDFQTLWTGGDATFKGALLF